MRGSTNKQVLTIEVQRETIRNYVALNRLPDPVFFADAATTSKIPLKQREAGCELLTRLRPGDHVVIAKLDRMCRSRRDMLDTLEYLERVGVRLHICNLAGGAVDMGTPIGRLVIGVLSEFAAFEREMISERTKEAMARVKRKGQRVSGWANYGFQWVKKYDRDTGGYKWTQVPDPEERAIMKKIVAWRAQDPPLSWDQCRQKITYELKLRTRRGKEWSRSRCFAAWRAELILQIKEARQGD
jgi:DNA invertase Pin-like site-specific DNA recombinase